MIVPGNGSRMYTVYVADKLQDHRFRIRARSGRRLLNASWRSVRRPGVLHPQTDKHHSLSAGHLRAEEGSVVPADCRHDGDDGLRWNPEADTSSTTPTKITSCSSETRIHQIGVEYRRLSRSHLEPARQETEQLRQGHANAPTWSPWHNGQGSRSCPR